MKQVPIRELNRDEFGRYGAFAQMIDPDAPKIGDEPIEFYRDMVQLPLGSATEASFSICRVLKRDPTIDTIEYHDGCGEGILPLDGDVLIHVAPATPNGETPLDDIEVFRVPRGTMVALRPGVWHHAPYAFGCDCANVVIVLPERTYATDCNVTELSLDQQIRIEGV